jgi:hypothetical protein
VSFTYAGVHRGSLTSYFADDSLLFFEGSVDQANIVKSILDRYEHGTGQLVSLGKCSIMYGERCSDEVQAEIK